MRELNSSKSSNKIEKAFLMENNQIEEQSSEMTVEDAEAQSSFFEAMIRLESNPDFQQVILHGYLRDEAVRLVSLTGIPVEQADIPMDEVLKDINGIGSFRYWLKRVRASTQIVKESLDEYKATILEQQEDAQAELDAEAEAQ